MSMPMPMPPSAEESMDMPAMHTSFFWGHRVQVLFSNWPGNNRNGVGMYVLSLLVVAVLAALVEMLSAASRGLSGRRRRRGSNALSVALLISGIHAVKMGLSYLVMLAVMSFNGGVFLAVLAGHAAGFLLSPERLGPAAAATHDDVPTTNGALSPSDVPTNGVLSPSEPKP